ncbi:MAG TPA: hypothetical protein VEU30_14500, partial [Thermoanaerobaculia bacterium]|nr:hypothetical protein [Thermoanaerobaculia bacterium]
QREERNQCHKDLFHDGQHKPLMRPPLVIDMVVPSGRLCATRRCNRIRLLPASIPSIAAGFGSRESAAATMPVS